MRDVRDKVALHFQCAAHSLICILQTGQHGVECACQLSNLIVWTFVIHAPGEITFLANDLRCLSNMMDGAQGLAGKNPSDAECNQYSQETHKDECIAQSRECLIALGKRLSDLNNEAQVSLINHW